MDSSDGLKVLFIGTPGSGKSTVINILRGEDACPTGKTLTAKGITTKREGYRSALQESKLDCDGIKVSFVKEIDKKATGAELIEQCSLIDTASSSKAWEDVAEEEGVHIFAFICPLSRYSERRKQFLEEIVSKFGDDFFSRCILILTQFSEDQKDTFEDDVSHVFKKDDNLRKLSNTHPYLVCPDLGKGPDSKEYKLFRNKFASSLFRFAFKCLHGTPVKQHLACTIL